MSSERLHACRAEPSEASRLRAQHIGRARREKVNSMFRLTLQLSFFLCIGIILFARFPPMLVLRPSILGCLKHVLLTPTGVDELFLE